MATGYVTNWGNDANDGLTWETSKRTFQGAKDVALSPVYAKGWFDESIEESALQTIDGANITQQNATTGVYFPARDSILRNSFISNTYRAVLNTNAPITVENCIIRNSYYAFINTYNNHSELAHTVQNTLIYNCSENRLTIKFYNIIRNNTFHKIVMDSLCTFPEYPQIFNKNNIYSNTAMWFIYVPYNSSYLLFINSKFKFTGGTLGTDETDYTYPIGADDNAKLQNLRDRMAAVYGGQASDYLIGCKYYSRNAPDGQEETEPYASAYKDIFVDADNGDFNLVEGCIAANMAYDGLYIGAKPVGTQLNLTDFTTNNIDSEGRIIDQEVDATANSNIIDLQKVRNIISFSALGDRASRNGQQINTLPNLGSPISAGANVLTDTKIYMVINDVITLDDAAATSYNPWDTFVATDEGGGAGLGFSTNTNGQIQEVLIDEYDAKIKVKASKTDSSLSTANQLTFYLYEEPKVNLDTNGIPILGNADAGYDENNAQPLYTRYMQFEILVKANNLPAR